MKKKQPNLFFKLLFICFLIYIALYIAMESGYYESKITKETIMTQEKIEEFEKDIKDGKEINIKDYTTKDYVDYSSTVSKIGNKIANNIDKFMDGGMMDFFKILSNLF